MSDRSGPKAGKPHSFSGSDLLQEGYRIHPAERSEAYTRLRCPNAVNNQAISMDFR